MKLGFHYHAPAKDINGGIYVSGFIGVFIDSIANDCDELILFLHSPLELEIESLDYKLKSDNIRLVNIGLHLPLYFRVIVYPWRIFTFRKELTSLDHLLIRSPTPVMFDFLRNIKKKNVTLYLVSDYLDNSKALNLPFVRKKIIQLWAFWFQKKLTRVLSKVNVLSNSEELKIKFSKFNKNIRVIRTSTLSSESFYSRPTADFSSVVRLVFTGRIDLSKGLIEMVEAMNLLKEEGIETSLSIAGWDTDKNFRNTTAVQKRAKTLGLSEKVIFLGKKSIGPELNEVYRSADIYLICSQSSEGFPRTVWEAMANSLPVIATNVGSLPYFLKDGEHALLIPPKDVNALTEAIMRVITDRDLRERIISNGYLLAEDNTLESQARRLIEQF